MNEIKKDQSNLKWIADFLGDYPDIITPIVLSTKKGGDYPS